MWCCVLDLQLRTVLIKCQCLLSTAGSVEGFCCSPLCFATQQWVEVDEELGGHAARTADPRGAPCLTTSRSSSPVTVTHSEALISRKPLDICPPWGSNEYICHCFAGKHSFANETTFVLTHKLFHLGSLLILSCSVKVGGK